MGFFYIYIDVNKTHFLLREISCNITSESFWLSSKTRLKVFIRENVAADTAYLYLQVMSLLEPGGVWYCFIVFFHKLKIDMSRVSNYINDEKDTII